MQVRILYPAHERHTMSEDLGAGVRAFLTAQGADPLNVADADWIIFYGVKVGGDHQTGIVHSSHTPLYAIRGLVEESFDELYPNA